MITKEVFKEWFGHHGISIDDLEQEHKLTISEKPKPKTTKEEDVSVLHPQVCGLTLESDEIFKLAEHGKKFRSKSLTVKKYNMYLQVLLKAELEREQVGKLNFRKACHIIALKFDLHQAQEQNSFYKSFMKYIKKHNINNLQDLKKTVNFTKVDENSTSE